MKLTIIIAKITIHKKINSLSKDIPTILCIDNIDNIDKN